MWGRGFDTKNNLTPATRLATTYAIIRLTKQCYCDFHRLFSKYQVSTTLYYIKIIFHQNLKRNAYAKTLIPN